MRRRVPRPAPLSPKPFTSAREDCTDGEEGRPRIEHRPGRDPGLFHPDQHRPGRGHLLRLRPAGRPDDQGDGGRRRRQGRREGARLVQVPGVDVPDLPRPDGGHRRHDAEGLPRPVRRQPDGQGGQGPGYGSQGDQGDRGKEIQDRQRRQKQDAGPPGRHHGLGSGHEAAESDVRRHHYGADGAEGAGRVSGTADGGGAAGASAGGGGREEERRGEGRGPEGVRRQRG